MPGPSVTIRVFASHPVVARAYRNVLASEEDFRVVGEGKRFHVGVFDGELDRLEEVLTVSRLKAPSMRPLLVSFPCEEDDLLRWLFRGLWGFVSYDMYEEELTRAVRRLAEGQFWFPPQTVARWKRIDTARRDYVSRARLTRREQQVVEFLFRRLSNGEIANILRISERTVKFHVRNILQKLELSSRREILTKWAPGLELS